VGQRKTIEIFVSWGQGLKKKIGKEKKRSKGGHNGRKNKKERMERSTHARPKERGGRGGIKGAVGQMGGNRKKMEGPSSQGGQTVRRGEHPIRCGLGGGGESGKEKKKRDRKSR